MARSNIVRVSLIGDSKELLKTFRDTEASSEKWGRNLGNVGKSMTTLVTAPILAGFAYITNAAADEKAEMELLAQVIENRIPNATQAMIDSNEDWITQLSYSIGVADGEIRGLEQQFIAAGSSIEDSQRLTALAYDVAKATGKDAASVASAFVKATNGQTAGLSKLGIQVKNADGSMKSFAQIQEELAVHSGTAAAAMDNEAGKAEIAKLKMADLAENMGMHLLPIKAKLLEIGMKIIDWFGNLDEGAQKGILAFLGIAAAVGPVLIVAGKMVTAFGQIGKAFSVMSKLFMANPWILLAAAVIAIVTLIVVNWDTIVAFLKKTWDGIKKTAENVWNGIKSFFKGVFDFIKNLFLNFTGPGLLIKHWDKIKEGVTSVTDFIKNTWNGVIEWFKGLPARVTSALSGLFNGLKSAFRNAVNFIIQKWNNFKLQIKLPSLLGGGTISIDTPNIPTFHDGGVFRAPVSGGEGLALLKDGETILPPGTSLAGGRGGGVTLNVTLNAGIGSDPDSIMEALESLRRRWERWNGPQLGNPRLA